MRREEARLGIRAGPNQRVQPSPLWKEKLIKKNRKGQGNEGDKGMGELESEKRRPRGGENRGDMGKTLAT